MFGPLFYLWRFAGIAVYADLSLVVLLAIWLLPSILAFNPEQALNVILFTVLLFGSITLHEFGHSLTARRLGYEVHRIVLNILGGAAVLDTSARKGSHEFLIAIAGPAVSILLWLLGSMLWPVAWKAGMPGTSALIAEVSVVNLYLAVFNLLPAFPLDGGRVFRSILTPRLGLLKATEVAARVGRGVAIFAGAYSVLRMLAAGGMIPSFRPISIAGLTFEGSPMMLMIAVYVYMAADMEYRMVLQEHYQTPFRWAESAFRERDGDSWRRGERDISGDVEVSPPPFEEEDRRNRGIRGFFRRLFRK